MENPSQRIALLEAELDRQRRAMERELSLPSVAVLTTTQQALPRQ